MSDFLLELRCEEIPARMQAGARADLEKLFRREMDAAGVMLGELTVWSTPRRLALIARGLPDATQAVSEETKGPRTSAPPQALEGFLRKTGLTQDQLIDRDGVYFAVVEKPGRATRDVLAAAIPAIVKAFPWPKSMRWGAQSLSPASTRWVRPLSGLVAMLGEEIVPVQLAWVQAWERPDGSSLKNVDDTGIKASATTVGHRFHHAGPITIGGADDYQEKLRACHVIVDHEERQGLVREMSRAAALAEGLTLVEDEGLVIENAGLTEWPVPLLGRFDPAFLDVPPEVIQLTARVNQKYFVCRSSPERGQGPPAQPGVEGHPLTGVASTVPLHHPADGPPPRAGEDRLANAFVCTANIEAADGGAAIVDGNRKVLAARLSDARFFWEQDRKTTLAEHAQKLERITFHEKLGTVADKVERVARLARWLVEEGIVPPQNGEGDHAQHGGGGVRPGAASLHAESPLHPQPAAGGPPPRAGEERKKLADMAEQAARLAKADLVTEMVGEFPELQGLMGGYYARAEGLPDAVADAIRDHYKPVGQGDDVPIAPVTVAVSLADKLDTLRSFFEVDEKPTGSKDPFALRRAALGIIRIVQDNGLRMPLAQGELLEFFADRLKVQQREAGVRHDLIDAVFALGGEDDLVRLLARVHALQAFMATADGANLLAGYKRAANILKKEDWTVTKGPKPDHKAQGIPRTGEEDPLAMVDDPDLAAVVQARMEIERGREQALSYSTEPAEEALIAALDSAEPTAARAVEAEDFAAAMGALASLRAPIDRFFEEVTVNDEDPAKRSARLDLLARFRDAVHRVADFSRIEG